MNELVSKVSVFAVLLSVASCAKTNEFGDGLGAAGSNESQTGGTFAVGSGGDTAQASGGAEASSGGTSDAATGGSTVASGGAPSDSGGAPGSSGGTTTSGTGGNGSDPCSDGVRTPPERSIDCGGTCPEQRCPIGATCFDAIDCVEGVPCVDGVCSLCSSGVVDGDESDVDCGGAVCDKCAGGQACVTNSDCASADCAAGICNEGTCLVTKAEECPCDPPNPSSVAKCEKILQCYIENDCSPAECSTDNMDTCGANTLQVDAEPMQAAEAAYDCACGAG